MKARYLILHRPKQYANRLWSRMSIIAMALETGAQINDLSFLERVPFAIKIMSKLTGHRRDVFATGAPKLLPPSAEFPERYAKYRVLFFLGWPYTNPAGFIKYRAQLLQQFGPNKAETQRIENLLNPFAGKVLIGVELKLLPYDYFADGSFLISEHRIADIIAEYADTKGLTHEQLALVIVSDKKPLELLQTYMGAASTFDKSANIHLLAKCSVVIGLNSRYTNLASWFGNVPHIVTTDKPVDWDYYRGKDVYFENKYADFALGKD
jgi:hypothetical protein